MDLVYTSPLFCVYPSSSGQLLAQDIVVIKISDAVVCHLCRYHLGTEVRVRVASKRDERYDTFELPIWEAGTPDEFLNRVKQALSVC